MEVEIVDSEYRPCFYRTLKNSLGLSDASIEWIEVAVRRLRKDFEVSGEASALSLADEFKVRVNKIALPDLSERWATLQILAVYQFLEYFIDAFRTEHALNPRSRKDEDLVSHALDVCKVSKSQMGLLEFEIVDYYRLIRNHIMHKQGEPQAKTHLTQLERIQKLISGSDYSALSAPNRIGALGFDDFILFSRAVKKAAKSMCIAVSPSPEKLLLMVKRDQPFLNSLRGSIQNADRIQNKLAAYLRTKFGYTSLASVKSQKLIELGLFA